jgi:hypothetical protein
LTSPPDRVELHRARDLNALISESFSLYRRHLWTFLAISVVVVVPVDSIVLGVGLGQFTGGYNSTPAPASAVVPILVGVLVVSPLVSVMVLKALLEMSAGREPRAMKAIQDGLDAFPAVFWPVLLGVLCEIGTLFTIILPLVLLVRWFFVPQIVMVEDRRGPEALRASWELTRGFAWRVAGLVLVVPTLFALAAFLIATPLAALARSLDSEAMNLAANAFAQTLVAAPLGIFAALLYFDLRARQSAVAS